MDKESGPTIYNGAGTQSNRGSSEAGSNIVNQVEEAVEAYFLKNETFHETEKRLTILENRLEGVHAQLQEMGTQVMFLEDRRLKVRARRIDCYRRDFHNDTSQEVIDRIAEGNCIEYNGDVFSDAVLYTSFYRSDKDIFVELYGLSPPEIATLEHSGSSNCAKVLNAWSTRATKVGKSNVPEHITEAFGGFVNVLRKDLTANPLVAGTELAEAYSKFWRVINT
ncbi:hypothetical protein FQN54_004676 [Arachnomyces sp. PD_36]|nr:hypothetical protein FQN54_004676 [Arachnomyces sp. PD_36]